jgi:hypothetical protein
MIDLPAGDISGVGPDVRVRVFASRDVLKAGL